MEQEPAGRGGGIEAVGQGSKIYPSFGEARCQFDKAPNGTTEPVELPDYERVSRTREVQRFRKTRPISSRAAPCR